MTSERSKRRDFLSLIFISKFPGCSRFHWKSSKWPIGIRILGNLENQALKLTFLPEFGFSLFLSIFVFVVYVVFVCLFVCFAFFYENT